MPGEGKSHKTYVVNIAEETTFKTEGTTKRAVGGPIQEQPSLLMKNTPLKVSKHDELGMNHKVEKGASEHAFGFPYAVEQWSALYHLLGGLIEQTHIIGVADSTGFSADDEVSIGSAIIGVIDGTPSATAITLKKFTVGEAVTITTGITGVIDRIKNNKIYVTSIVGVPDASGTIIGDDSGAKISYSAYASGVFTITDQPAVTDTITNDSGSTTELITALTYHHYIFVYREPPSFSMIYNLISTTSQHLLLGGVCSDINIKGSGNEIPKITENWLVSNMTPDTTKDDGIDNTTTDLYKFEQLTLIINSVSYTDLVKTRDITLKRDLAKLITTSLDPTGIKGPMVESQIKLGIYRTDYEFYDLNINDTRFPVVFTWTRDSHSCAITFANCKGLEFTESENDKSIFVDMPFEIEGTPTAVIIDDVPNYGL